MIDLEHALERLRTPTGAVLMSTAGVGVFMAAHWRALIPVMLALYFVTVIAPDLARRAGVWTAVAVVWAVAVVVRRSAMEDHVYLYLAWLAAVAVSLIHPSEFIDRLGRHGRYLIAIVFAFATFWKLVSGSFVNGVALWTIGLLDDRMGPLFRLAGISEASLDAARPEVAAVVHGSRSTYDIELSGYSTAALVGVAIGTLAIEGIVALTHAVDDTSWFARWRAPALVTFGIVTYAIVPVLPFALLLAVIGSTIAKFDRATVIAFGVVVAVTLVRFITL